MKPCVRRPGADGVDPHACRAHERSLCFVVFEKQMYGLGRSAAEGELEIVFGSNRAKPALQAHECGGARLSTVDLCMHHKLDAQRSASRVERIITSRRKHSCSWSVATKNQRIAKACRGSTVRSVVSVVDACVNVTVCD